uniref:Uncharacterized protein n=1 Tax=Rhizophora mucronata TaxID=61149 RepID=A0A2P2J048_RHIMU
MPACFGLHSNPGPALWCDRSRCFFSDVPVSVISGFSCEFVCLEQKSQLLSLDN